MQIFSFPETQNRSLDDFQYQDCLDFNNETHVLIPANAMQKCAKFFKRQKPTMAPTANQQCLPIARNPEEFRTAFLVNIICISLPIFVFWTMCSRELWLHLKDKPKLKYLFWPLSLICSPFFILYIAFKQVIFKFLHKR